MCDTQAKAGLRTNQVSIFFKFKQFSIFQTKSAKDWATEGHFVHKIAQTR